jgi:diguanylate cyclase (GGDEF)-like protein/PAS domain S-box-containing protein
MAGQKNSTNFDTEGHFEEWLPILRSASFIFGAPVAAIVIDNGHGLRTLVDHGLLREENDQFLAFVQRWHKVPASLQRLWLAQLNVETPADRLRLVHAVQIRSGNTNAALFCVGARSVDFVKGRRELAAFKDVALTASYHMERMFAHGSSGQTSKQVAPSSQELLLFDAIDALPEAIAVFDDAERFVHWNAQFRLLYESKAVKLRVGLRFEDHVRAGVNEGMVPAALGREEEWLAARMARFRAGNETHDHQLANQRWVRVSDRRLHHGGMIGIRSDITDLVHREHSFRVLFNANPAPMIIIDRDSLHVVAVNDAAVLFYGYDRETFLTLSLAEIRPEQNNDQIQTRLHFDAGSKWPDMVRIHKTSNGEERTVNVQARLLDFNGKAAILAAITDITEQQALQRQLHHAQAFLGQVIEQVPYAVFVKDAWDNGRYILCNRAIETLIGRPREDILGRSDAELFGAQFARQITEEDEAILRTGASAELPDKIIPHLDGSTRWIRSRKIALADEAGGGPRYLLGITQDVTELKVSEENMAYRAYHDALTDLPNRLLLVERMEFELARLEEMAAKLAFLMLDLDGFKAVNDTWGHPAGDALLKAVASRLAATIRTTDTAGRLGGDEFAVLLSPVSTPAQAAWFATQLVDGLSRPFWVDGTEIRISVSIGVVITPHGSIGAAALMRQADEALYKAKKGGRNQYCLAPVSV